MNKIHFTSLGCARNLVDTEVMIGILLRSGYEIIPDHLQADYLVVNTCGFLEAAREEAYETLDELFQEKKSQAKLIVAGCMVHKHRHILKEKFPEIHAFISSGDVDKVLTAIQTTTPNEQVTDAKSYLQQGEVPRLVTTPSHYAYLKIAEGCKKQCAFCIIPKIKGPLQSKTEEQVLKEFRILRAQGVFEVILIAQDLGDYGKDRREKHGLESLLKKLLAEEGEFWLRLLYLYPDEITNEIIELIASDKRLCPYLDMPIQHINDTMLKAMHRKTSRQQILTIIQTLREKIPNIVIRTSLMVGFPGETDAQFQELIDFVKEAKLDNVGIFKFSLEKEAYAARLPNQIDEAIKEERFNILAEAQYEATQHNLSKYLGQKLEVIVEDYHPESEHLMVGRFYGQCPDIDGQIILNDTLKVDAFSRLYEVEITDILEYDLLGKVLRPLFTNSLALI